ncbi:pectate lyase family protein [Paenibacillus gallinarum]|nr:RICIN domain-containing protein [Paenibacillus gallinarum]
MANQKKLISMMLAVMVMMAIFFPSVGQDYKAFANPNYPYQEIKIVGSNHENINITGFNENDPINFWPSNGESNERWRLSTTDGINFKIINMRTGKLLSALASGIGADTAAVLRSDEGDEGQLWKFISVETDVNGDALRYKIVSKRDESLALTLDTSNQSVNLKTYTGEAKQKFKLESDGLIGFAGHVNADGGEKTGTIGGLLGKTVFVSDLTSFKDALLNPDPLTIVIAANINSLSEVYDLRIASNKTIIGSYGANTLVDPRLRTDDYFKVQPVSNNIIIKNVNISVENREDVVAIAVYGSRNIWIDHSSFSTTLPLDKDEVGKFIWVNRSIYAAQDPDFVTLSYNNFYHRYWGVAFGAGFVDKDRATAAYNKFDSVIHRTPQLGNGKLHALNNFMVRTHAGTNNDGYSSLNVGAGGQVYSNANRFEGYRKESSGYWDNEVSVDTAGYFTDTGSYTDKAETPPFPLPYPLPTPSGNPSPWNPITNYNFQTLKAYDANGMDVKGFVNAYSGASSFAGGIKYIHYPELSAYLN